VLFSALPGAGLPLASRAYILYNKHVYTSNIARNWGSAASACL